MAYSFLRSELTVPTAALGGQDTLLQTQALRCEPAPGQLATSLANYSPLCERREPNSQNLNWALQQTCQIWQGSLRQQFQHCDQMQQQEEQSSEHEECEE